VAPRPEGDSVLRVESDHRDFAVDVPSDALKNFLENPGVEIKRRADVESESTWGRNGRATSSDHISRFQNGNIRPSVCQLHGCSQSAGTGSHDDYFFSGHPEFISLATIILTHFPLRVIAQRQAFWGRKSDFSTCRKYPVRLNSAPTVLRYFGPLSHLLKYGFFIVSLATASGGQEIRT
jgi:hypothetical protein